MSLFGSHRADRRRRALADDRSGDSSAPVVATSAAKTGAAKPQRYASSASRENHRRVSDFVPRNLLPLALWYLAGLSCVAGLLVGFGRWLDHARAATSGTSIALTTTVVFNASQGGSLAGWFSSLLFGLAAAGGVLVYSIRRYKVDDYRGRYRLWLWCAAAWLVMSIDATANLHAPFAQALAAATGWTTTADPAMLWIGIWGAVLAILALRLVIEMRECRTATAAIVLVFSLWLAALAIEFDWLPGGQHATVIASGCRLLGQVTLLFTTGLYARHVLLDAEGLLTIREPKPRREKQAKKLRATASSMSDDDDDSEAAKPVRTDLAHTAGGKRTDLHSHVQTVTSSNRGSAATAVAGNGVGSFAPNRSAVAGSADIDDADRRNDRRPSKFESRHESDDDDGDAGTEDHKLSKAERKRLRKLARRQQRGAE